MDSREQHYNNYVEIAEGIYWVGFADKSAGLHCNPYLIVDGDEAVLIDAGSRYDFSTVVLKIMRTGTDPKIIRRLIYQHYDPDLCGNIPHMEELIRNPDLRILSHRENNIFINYYSVHTRKDDIESMGFHYEFGNGRKLKFFRTPYSHSPGSFVTYDEKTKVLFSSDLFGSYDSHWDLYSNLTKRCLECSPQDVCPETNKDCELKGIFNFHRRIMTSEKALRYALEQMKKLDISMIAPQHGSVLYTPESIEVVFKRLAELDGIGIDGWC